MNEELIRQSQEGLLRASSITPDGIAAGALTGKAFIDAGITMCATPLSQQSQDCDLSGLPMIIAGALYDFTGYLTTRPVSVKYGASELAGPMVDALKEWAEMRGLPLDDAAVQSWHEHITRAAEQVNAEDYSKVPMGPVGATYIGDTILPAPPSSQPDTVAVPRACEWLLSDEFEGDTWDGQCGAKWTFPDGGPRENDMHYCPNCGRKLTIRTAQEGKK